MAAWKTFEKQSLTKLLQTVQSKNLKFKLNPLSGIIKA